MLVNNILYIQWNRESLLDTHKYYWIIRHKEDEIQLLVVFSIFSVNYEQICFPYW